MNRTIRMALTKGRIEKGAVSLLEAAGYGCAGLRDKGRRLIVPTDGGEIDVVFAKAADVITYVETGACWRKWRKKILKPAHQERTA